MRCNRFQVVLAIAAVTLLALAASAGAAVVVTADHIVSSAYGVTDTLQVVDNPSSTMASGGTFSGPAGPDWAENADDGFALLAGSVIVGEGNRPGWEPDGTGDDWYAAPRIAYSRNAPNTQMTWSFDLPDASIIHNVYADWRYQTNSGTDHVYSYDEGTPTTLTRPAGASGGDLVLQWTSGASTDYNVNFQRLFAGPITVAGGNGFALTFTHGPGGGHYPYVDAVVLDVTLPAGGPEPLAISINFASTNPHTDVVNVDGVAGALPVGNWNNVANATGNGPQGPVTSLVDSNGDATTAAVTWNAPETWEVGPTTTEDDKLMRGYLDTSNTVGVQIDVTDIPYDEYDLYLYHSSAGGNGRDMSIELLGLTEGNQIVYTEDEVGDGFNGAWTEHHAPTLAEADGSGGGNYVLLTGLVGPNLTILTTPLGGGTMRAPVQGIQIVNTAVALVPEPSTFVLAALGLLALAWFGRRRRRLA